MILFLLALALADPQPAAAPPSPRSATSGYPAEAARLGVAGKVMVEGVVGADGKVTDCKVVSEEPAGQGFGEAAVKLCATFRMKPRTDPAPAPGDPPQVVKIPIRFAPPSSGPCAIAEPEIAPGAAIPLGVTCPEPDYPAAARDAGHQGDVEITALIRPDGTVAEPAVKVSSRSAELDQAALAAFSRWTFKPARDAAGQPREARVTRMFSFEKDHALSLGEKTCADFVADVRWFETAWPGRKRSDMRLYTMSNGLLFILKMQKSSPQDTLALIRRFPQAYDATVERCEAKPKAKYLAVLLAQLD